MAKKTVLIFVVMLLALNGVAYAAQQSVVAYDALVADRPLMEKAIICDDTYFDLIDMGDVSKDYGLVAMLKIAEMEPCPTYDRSLLPEAPMATLLMTFGDAGSDTPQSIQMHVYEQSPYVLVEGDGAQGPLSGVYSVDPALRVFVLGVMAYMGESE